MSKTPTRLLSFAQDALAYFGEQSSWGIRAKAVLEQAAAIQLQERTLQDEAESLLEWAEKNKDLSPEACDVIRARLAGAIAKLKEIQV